LGTYLDVIIAYFTLSERYCGRPYIYGLATNGAMGVAQVIRLLRDELEMTMALMG
jgi:isopentenyl diphosphate isomerase/L-lactate dehydrogenase-like FMN-dependent dehydrogenase